MKTLLRFVFELKGDFSPDVISSRVSLQPTEVWRKGDVGKFKVAKQYDYWSLDSGYVNTLEIYEVSESIYANLKQKKAEFTKLISETNLTAVFSIVAKIDGDNTPSISFPEEVVKLASELGASIDLDLYVNKSDEG